MKQLTNITDQVIKDQEFQDYLTPNLALMGMLGFVFEGISAVQTENTTTYTLSFIAESVGADGIKHGLQEVRAGLEDDGTDVHIIGDTVSQLFIIIVASV